MDGSMTGLAASPGPRAVAGARGVVALLLLAIPAVLSAQESGRTGAAAEADRPEARVVFTLEEAVKRGLVRNREVMAARHGLENAGEQVSHAWGNLWPRLDLSTSYSRNLEVQKAFLPAVIFDPDASPTEQVPVQFGSDNTWSLGLTWEQIVFDPRVFIGVGAAGRFETLQREVVRGREQAAATRIRVAYYDVLLAREDAELTAESLERVRETLRESRALFEAGFSSEFDVLRLEVDEANLGSALRRARNRIAEARRNLAVELALEDLDGVAVEGSLAEMDLESPESNDPANREILAFGSTGPFSPVDPEEAVALAVRRRSDVRQAEQTEELRKTEMRVEQVEYLPKVSLFGNYSLTAQENGNPNFFGESSNQRATSQAAGIQVTLPIFTGFQRDALVDQRRATLRQARAQSALARDRAEAQVKNLLDRVSESRERARAQEQAVGRARRGYEIASAEYREGIGSRLALTDAEVALRESEFNYAQAVYDYLVAQARLDEATGQVPLVDEIDLTVR